MVYGQLMEPEISYVGKIVFDDIIEEKNAGNVNLKSLGECEIQIYSNEGPVPHIHILNSSGFDCCIEIEDNKFFDHGKHKDKLNSYQCRQLYEWMNKQSKLGNNDTNWEICKIAWNLSNEKYLITKSKCPRYDLMK